MPNTKYTHRPNVEYRFQVCEVNTCGQGPWSAIVAVTIPGAPCNGNGEVAPALPTAVVPALPPAGVEPLVRQLDRQAREGEPLLPYVRCMGVNTVRCRGESTVRAEILFRLVHDSMTGLYGMAYGRVGSFMRVTSMQPIVSPIVEAS